MTLEQTVLLLVVFAALVLFVTERWRYDIVALLALLAVTLTGVVPADAEMDFPLEVIIVLVAVPLILWF
jgi:di/tricarboxylate transporter